jgi:rRNA-processing protein EBP2
MTRTGFKKLKASPKAANPKPKQQELRKPAAAVSEVAQSTGAEADLSSGEDSDEDAGGVNEEGMSNLMRLLGEDGLDDVAEQHLSELGLDEEASGSDEEDDEDESNSDEEDAVVGDGGSDSDSGWVDEDEEMEVPEGSRPPAVDDGESTDDENEEGDAIPLDEVSDVDEDTVPKQKVVINNEVSIFSLSKSSVR